MATFLLVPYERVPTHPAYTTPMRRLAIDRHSPEIGVDWIETEIDGDQAIVASDFTRARLAKIAADEGWQILDSPETVWTSHRTAPINRGGEIAFDSGETFPSLPLEHLARRFERKPELQRIADGLMQKAEREGYAPATDLVFHFCAGARRVCAGVFFVRAEQ